MSSETCQLADIAIIQGGYAFKSADFGDEGVAVVKIANIKPPVVSLDDVDRVTPDKVVGLARFRLNDGDVLMAMTGATVGKVGRFQERESAYLNQRVARISARHGKEYLDFIYAVVSQPGFDSLIEGASAGSAQANISAAGIGAVQIPLLDGKEQLAIGQIARALDDRITLLRETNATLEAIAQALFKSWFVDFDPVRAKMEGRTPEGMDEATAALFPDGFETSELGEVPRGWRYSTVGESFVLTMGQSPPGDTYNDSGEGLAFYQGRTDFGFRFPTQRVFCSAPTRYAEPGDTLVSVRAPVGDVNMALERCCIGRGVASVRHSSGFRGFVFYAMHGLRERFKTFDSEGTVFGSISKKDFQSLPVVVAPEDVLRAYDAVAAPIDQRIAENEVMLRTLSTLRDTLLPRLISGQLRLPEAQAATEAALGGTLSV